MSVSFLLSIHIFFSFIQVIKGILFLQNRYKEEVAQKIVSKNKVVDPHLLDERWSSEMNLLSTTALCVRLNTLHISAASQRVPKYIYIYRG